MCLESGPSHLFCPLRPLDIQPEAEMIPELLFWILCLLFAVPYLSAGWATGSLEHCPLCLFQHACLLEY